MMPVPLSADELAAVRERMDARPLMTFGDRLSDEERERVRAAFRDRRSLLEMVEAYQKAIDDIQEFVVAHCFDTTVGRRIDQYITERTRDLLGSEAQP